MDVPPLSEHGIALFFSVSIFLVTPRPHTTLVGFVQVYLRYILTVRNIFFFPFGPMYVNNYISL